MRTELAALSKEFDYTVPASWADPVVVGTRVRVPLHGRTVRGWVVADHVAPTQGLEVRPLKSWLGWGPPAPVVGLAGWAAWRWAGPESAFLQSASPNAIVRSLTAAPPPPAPHPPASSTLRQPRPFWADLPPDPGAIVVRLPPTTDLIDLVLSVVTGDSARTPKGGPR